MAYFRHVFLTIFLLCISIISTKCDLIRDECVRAHNVYVNTDVNRCIKLLSSDPNAANATNVLDLTVAALALGERTANQIVQQINATLASGKLSPELLSIVSEIRDQMNIVKVSFYSAHGIVKGGGNGGEDDDEDDGYDGNDFDDGDYAVATMTDSFRIVRILVSKANGKIDQLFYQRSLQILSVLRNVGLVLIADAEPHNKKE